MSGAAPLAAGVGRGGRPVALGSGVVALDIQLEARRRRQVDRRGEHLEHHLAVQAHALGVGVDHHPLLGQPRTRRHQRARALELDHADPAGIRRRQRLAEAQRRCVDLERAAGIEQRRALCDGDLALVDRQLDGARCAHEGTPPSLIPRTRPAARSPTRSHLQPSAQGRRSRSRACRCRRRSSSASSSATLPRAASRDQPRECLLLAHGPDPARRALTARLVAEEAGDPHQHPREARTVSSNASTTPEPSVAPAPRDAFERQRNPELVGPDERAGGAAQQHRLQTRPPGTPPARSSSSPSVSPNGTS